jgi:hypothetical protein
MENKKIKIENGKNGQIDEKRQIVKLAMLDTLKEDIFMEGLLHGENQYGKYIGLKITGNRIIFVNEGSVAYENVIDYFNDEFPYPYPDVEHIKNLKINVVHGFSNRTLKPYNVIKIEKVK